MLLCIEKKFLKQLALSFLYQVSRWQQEAAPLPSRFPESARTREKLQFSNVRRDTQVSQCLHLINSTVRLSLCISNSLCHSFLRTLLALGCHVGMGDEKAEENLKRTKLPKTWVARHSCILIVFYYVLQCITVCWWPCKGILITNHCSLVTCRVTVISQPL